MAEWNQNSISKFNS